MPSSKKTRNMISATSMMRNFYCFTKRINHKDYKKFLLDAFLTSSACFLSDSILSFFFQRNIRSSFYLNYVHNSLIDLRPLWNLSELCKGLRQPPLYTGVNRARLYRS